MLHLRGKSILQKKSRNLLKYVKVYFVFSCKWRGVGKKGRKRGRGLRGNFPLELFFRISFPCPWLQLKITYLSIFLSSKKIIKYICSKELLRLFQRRQYLSTYLLPLLFLFLKTALKPPVILSISKQVAHFPKLGS